MRCGGHERHNAHLRDERPPLRASDLHRVRWQRAMQGLSKKRTSAANCHHRTLSSGGIQRINMPALKNMSVAHIASATSRIQNHMRVVLHIKMGASRTLLPKLLTINVIQD